MKTILCGLIVAASLGGCAIVPAPMVGYGHHRAYGGPVVVPAPVIVQPGVYGGVYRGGGSGGYGGYGPGYSRGGAWGRR